MVKIPVIIISLMIRKTKCVHCLVALNRITTTTLCKACPSSMCKVIIVMVVVMVVQSLPLLYVQGNGDGGGDGCAKPAPAICAR